MKGDKFTTGDEVALSATFLRSIDPSAAAGWPGRGDLGIGTVIQSFDCGGIDLVDVWFPSINYFRRVNSFNLVHRRDIAKEADKAQHSRRNVEINR